jgi:hypothetical protein
MALKPDRDYHAQTDITTVWGGGNTATRGGVASIATATSGTGLSSKTTVEYAADPSGAVPMGCLLQDIVNVDLNQYTVNRYKEEVSSQASEPNVTLIRKGWVITNSITGTPTAGAVAYLGANGNFTPTRTHAAHPIVGRFETPIDDATGYAKVYLDI